MMDIIYEGRATAAFHMQQDRELITHGRGAPLLRFYEWEKVCITTGMFIDAEKFVDLEKCREHEIEIAKRPTGGGLLFHGHDMPFTLFFPANHPLFVLPIAQGCAEINDTIRHALSPWLPRDTKTSCVGRSQRCELCMAQKTGFDLLWSGYKIGGCAQRKTKKGLLHQVSLFFTLPDWELLSLVLCRDEDLYAMQKESKAFVECMEFLPKRKDVRESIMNAFKV